MIGLHWIAFIAFILALLFLDLCVIHRKAQVIGTGKALAWTSVWVTIALAFNGCVYFLYDRNLFGIGLDVGHPLDGRQAALQFFTGWLVEYTLSMDNIFVIAVIFGYFAVPPEYQHRVLFWGILGALAMRGVMIALGAALVNAFAWMTQVLGVLLLLSAVKLLRAGEERPEPERNPLVRLARFIYPVSTSYEGPAFFTRLDGKRAITPLFLVLLVVESTDLLFAIDSIPAIFGYTKDPFLVFTSNAFAILGLRSLYFALAGLMATFRYIKVSLVFILAFTGVKMLLPHDKDIPTEVAVLVILALLAVGVVSSIVARRRDEKRGPDGAGPSS